MFICLCKDTGAMNRSPTPGGVFCGVSWVDVGILRNVLWCFVGGCYIISKPFAALLQVVSSIIADRSQL